LFDKGDNIMIDNLPRGLILNKGKINGVAHNSGKYLLNYKQNGVDGILKLNIEPNMLKLTNTNIVLEATNLKSGVQSTFNFISSPIPAMNTKDQTIIGIDGQFILPPILSATNMNVDGSSYNIYNGKSFSNNSFQIVSPMARNLYTSDSGQIYGFLYNNNKDISTTNPFYMVSNNTPDLPIRLDMTPQSFTMNVISGTDDSSYFIQSVSSPILRGPINAIGTPNISDISINPNTGIITFAMDASFGINGVTSLSANQNIIISYVNFISQSKQGINNINPLILTVQNQSLFTGIPSQITLQLYSEKSSIIINNNNILLDLYYLYINNSGIVTSITIHFTVNINVNRNYFIGNIQYNIQRNYDMSPLTNIGNIDASKEINSPVDKIIPYIVKVNNNMMTYNNFLIPSNGYMTSTGGSIFTTTSNLSPSITTGIINETVTYSTFDDMKGNANIKYNYMVLNPTMGAPLDPITGLPIVNSNNIYLGSSLMTYQQNIEFVPGTTYIVYYIYLPNNLNSTEKNYQINLLSNSLNGIPSKLTITAVTNALAPVFKDNNVITVNSNIPFSVDLSQFVISNPPATFTLINNGGIDTIKISDDGNNLVGIVN